MRTSWWMIAALAIALAAVLVGQQTEPEELTDSERITRLEARIESIERAIAATPEVAPNLLEARLSRTEARLDRFEQQAIRGSGTAAVSSDRLIEGRIRSLENAIMQLQMQRR